MLLHERASNEALFPGEGCIPPVDNAQVHAQVPEVTDNSDWTEKDAAEFQALLDDMVDGALAPRAIRDPFDDEDAARARRSRTARPRGRTKESVQQRLYWKFPSATNTLVVPPGPGVASSLLAGSGMESTVEAPSAPVLAQDSPRDIEPSPTAVLPPAMELPVIIISPPTEEPPVTAVSHLTKEPRVVFPPSTVPVTALLSPAMVPAMTKEYSRKPPVVVALSPAIEPPATMVSPPMNPSPLPSNLPPLTMFGALPQEAAPQVSGELVIKLGETAAPRSASWLHGGPELTVEQLGRPYVPPPAEGLRLGRPDISVSAEVPPMSPPPILVPLEAPTVPPITSPEGPLTFHHTLAKLSHLSTPPPNPFACLPVVLMPTMPREASSGSVVEVRPARRTCGRDEVRCPFPVAKAVRNISADVKYNRAFSLAEPERRAMPLRVPTVPRATMPPAPLPLSVRAQTRETPDADTNGKDVEEGEFVHGGPLGPVGKALFDVGFAIGSVIARCAEAVQVAAG